MKGMVFGGSTEDWADLQCVGMSERAFEWEVVGGIREWIWEIASRGGGGVCRGECA